MLLQQPGGLSGLTVEGLGHNEAANIRRISEVFMGAGFATPASSSQQVGSKNW